MWSALNLSAADGGPKLGLGMETVTEGTGLLLASLLFRAAGSVGLRFFRARGEREGEEW